MMVGVCSDKGSPGSTTTALVLASAWPGPAVVVEADPQGGDLAIRLRRHGGAALPEVPTVLTVATAARRSPPADLLNRHAHELSRDVSVIPGALVAEQAAGVAEWEPLADALTATETPVFADFGRLQGTSQLVAVAARADVMIVVGRNDPGSVIRLRERLARLAPELAAHRETPPRLLPVLVSAERHAQGDIADLRRLLTDTPARPFLGGFGHIALDPSSLRRLEAGEEPLGRLARTPLLRSARKLTGQLTHLLGHHSPGAWQAEATGSAR